MKRVFLCLAFKLAVFAKAFEIIKLQNLHLRAHALAFLLFTVLIAEESNNDDFQVARYDQSHQLMMGPSAIVDGCVNAITGSFFDAEVDLEVPGTGLNVSRQYCSLASKPKAMTCENYEEEVLGLFDGWSWNHTTIMYWRPYWDVATVGSIDGGMRDVYELAKEGRLHTSLLKGWNNTGKGCIGAKYDCHNQRLEKEALDAEGYNWILTLEDGTQRFFNKFKIKHEKKERNGSRKKFHWICHEDRRC